MLGINCTGVSKIFRFVDKFFQVIWIVIRRLCLQPLLTVGVVMAVLAACLPKEKLGVSFIITFIVLILLAIVYAIIGIIVGVVAYIREGKKKTKKKKVEVGVDEILSGTVKGGATYYRVAQNPKYVMAEYPDRYELYYDDDGELKFVKVTLKTKEREDND